MRKTPLVVGEYYHVYNRGTDKRPIFNDLKDLDRFMLSMKEFNSIKPVGSIRDLFHDKHQPRRPTSGLVEFVAYCLNFNHFHLLLKQNVDNGISEFMKRLGGGYTKYFNDRYKRNGVLFQGRFKSSHVDSNEYLLHLSVYINLNNKQKEEDSKAISRSSQEEYTSVGKDGICNTEIVLSQFKNRNHYNDFAKSSLEEIVKRKILLKELDL